jgi:multiple RNA-binding domain-containing protein 1
VSCLGAFSLSFVLFYISDSSFNLNRSHGHLRSVRLPKKFDSRSRGFAFLDFISRHEAENAFSALHHTHLLGRHLVLEWAEEGEQDLDVLRKKAGVGYGEGTELPGRKRKLELGDILADGDEERM